MIRFTSATLLLGISLSLNHSAYAQEQSAIVEKYETHVDAFPNSITTTYDVYIKILNPAGDQYGEIYLPERTNNKIKIEAAEILDEQHNLVRKIKKKEIEYSSLIYGGEFYTDNMLYKFTLKHHLYPYIAHYKYTEHVNQYLSIVNWSPRLNIELETKQSKLVVELSDNMNYTKHVKNGLFDFDSTQLENSTKYEWKIENLPELRNEANAPPLREIAPKIYIIPEKINYITDGNTNSWADYGNWNSQLLIGKSDLASTEIERIKSLVSGINDTTEIIQKIYQDMQEKYRYIYVGIDEGGLVPYPASYVCEKRFGDCKGLTNYMRAALESIGIDSYYCSLFSGRRPIRVDTSIITHQSNHVILMVPLQHDTIWLENTVSYFPANYLGTFTQDRFALVHNGDQSKLVRTPALDSADVVVTNNYELTLACEKLGLIGHYTSEIKGRRYEHIAALEQKGNVQHLKKLIESMVGYPNTVLINQAIGVDSLLPIGNIKADFEAKHALRKIGLGYKVTIPNLGLNALEKLEERQLPVRINYPTVQKDTIRINIEDATKQSFVFPEAKNLKNEFGSYSIQYTLEKNQVVITRSFYLKKGDYSLEKYPEFFEFFQEIKEHQKPFIFQPAL